MKNLIRNKWFLFGFISGIIFILFVNIYYLFLDRENCFYCHYYIGFPAPVYEKSEVFLFDNIIWFGILANIIITLMFSFLVGLFCRVIFSNLISKKVLSDPKNKIYNNAFKIGFFVNILFFLILNYFSYVTAYNKYINRKHHTSADGYSWGFPAEIYRSFLGYPQNDVGFRFDGVVINVFFAVVCGFILGKIFRFIWSKFTSQRIELN